MRTGYKVLRGADPLSAMTVRPADLRAALERGVRGKLMRLRQGYALFMPGSDELTEFVRSSAGSLLLLCRGPAGADGGSVPAEAPPVVQAAAARAGFSPEAITRIIAARGDQKWRCTEEDVQGYLAAVEAAARFVDHFKIGAPT